MFDLNFLDVGEWHHDLLPGGALQDLEVPLVGGDAGDAFRTISEARAVFTTSTRSLSAGRRIMLKKPENFVSKNRRLNMNWPRWKIWASGGAGPPARPDRGDVDAARHKDFPPSALAPPGTLKE